MECVVISARRMQEEQEERRKALQPNASIQMKRILTVSVLHSLVPRRRSDAVWKTQCQHQPAQAYICIPKTPAGPAKSRYPRQGALFLA